MKYYFYKITYVTDHKARTHSVNGFGCANGIWDFMIHLEKKFPSGVTLDFILETTEEEYEKNQKYKKDDI